MRFAGPSLALFLLLGSWLGAEPVVKTAKVVSEVQAGTTWTVLTGRAEAETEVSATRLALVLTDWSAYPRIFPKIQKVVVVPEEGSVLLTETTLVSVLGFTVSNRFTIRIVTTTSPSGTVSIRWTQVSTDGRIDRLEGGWDLEPTLVKGLPGTLVRYHTVSAVAQSFPGQDGLVSLFFPGELKQIISSVLAEARERKEKP